MSGSNKSSTFVFVLRRDDLSQIISSRTLECQQKQNFCTGATCKRILTILAIKEKVGLKHGEKCSLHIDEEEWGLTLLH